MSSRWEGIVTVARDVDEAFARGAVPDAAMVMRLARALIDFQQYLTNTGARLPYSMLPPHAPDSSPTRLER